MSGDPWREPVDECIAGFEAQIHAEGTDVDVELRDLRRRRLLDISTFNVGAKDLEPITISDLQKTFDELLKTSVRAIPWRRGIDEIDMAAARLPITDKFIHAQENDIATFLIHACFKCNGDARVPAERVVRISCRACGRTIRGVAFGTPVITCMHCGSDQ